MQEDRMPATMANTPDTMRRAVPVKCAGDNVNNCGARPNSIFGVDAVGKKREFIMIASFFISRICRAFPILAGVFFMQLTAILTFALMAVAVCCPDAALAAPPTPTVSAQPVGNSLYINAYTSVNVSWEIQIKSDKAPTGNPPSFGGPATKTANNGSKRWTSFANLFQKVQPGTTYYYIAKATDASGQSSYRTGSVKALNRDLTFTISRVEILADGDPEWYRGAGEIKFALAYNKCWAKEWQTGYLSRSKGQSYYPNRSASFSHYHGQVLSFAVYGWESDADFGEFSPDRLRPIGCQTSINAGHESSNDGDWAQAVTNINFNTAPFVHTQNTATETWTFLSPSAAKLRYKVYVTLNFNYGGSASPIARRR